MKVEMHNDSAATATRIQSRGTLPRSRVVWNYGGVVFTTIGSALHRPASKKIAKASRSENVR